MKTIKFRGWNGKEMLYKISIGLKPIDDLDTFFKETAEDGFVWMQFTGLLDENRNEIFEGDIVKWGFGFPEVCVVVEDYADFKLESADKERHRMPDHRSLEVIGNIYEHPNLLSREKAE